MPTNAPSAAKPSKSIFDPFNSSATGHQRADNRLSGSISWRDSRSLKLREQFNAGAGGGKRVSDTVGAGSLDFGQDGRTGNGGWVKGASGLRTGGQKSIRESLGGSSGSSHGSSPSRLLLSPIAPFDTTPEAPPSINPEQSLDNPTPPPPPSQIFKNLTLYINGSTAPTMSDHKLKHLISTHGGNLSIALGRRTVTHVILGKPNSAGGGCGGGLAGSKIQKEVARRGGCAVKFVTVEWVVESVKAGKRLSEARFEGVRIAPRGVRSLLEVFGAKGDGGEAGKG
ncbi:hypothetical protein EJ03DRAFT_266598 [Teratosphaeria nubilosa]|uniref:BRCT domain-containing protein n=1 Tax=Teratosphaeria nubilosa TaxID=161662 RepID=A0A6G1LIS3_9PEZI|nr:hypothetical protein EJ03DRAFT_266598 [Teratosphaeria nubilosa]